MVLQKDWIRKWIAIPVLMLVSGLAYLPNIGRFGYFRDDWYLMYAANAMGGGAFQGIYEIDRPWRALVMSGAYSLFGIDPLYYNLAAFVLRLLGGLAFLWTLRILWPRQRFATTLAAILFLIYPGFISTPNAIDYHAQQMGLFLAQVSIAFSLKAATVNSRIPQILLWASSVVMAWAYLGFVEYFLGFEVLRFAAFAVLAGRTAGPGLWNRVTQTLLRWAPFALGPLGFVFWRFFIFQSDRKATDLGAQLAEWAASPLLMSVRWVTLLLQDSFEVLVLSWGVPLTNVWNTSLRIREVAFAGLIVVLGVFAVVLFSRYETTDDPEGEDPFWRKEAFWLGLACIVAGFLPVILSNREANFVRLSRYMLASSAGAVIIVAALIDQFKSQTARLATAALLVSTSMLAHYFNGIQWAQISDAQREFWWQVSWRIPQLQPGTTLVANYSGAAIEEDYFVWGPANFIYYPESTDPEKLRPALWGLVLSPENVVSIQNEVSPVAINRRSILTFMDYRNILILTQPTSASCVQVIGGSLPSVSEFEQHDIRAVASASDLSLILLDKQPRVPSEIVFGPEPEHDWCYFFQQASIAYQRGDWEGVLELRRQASRQGFEASDPVEWMPFLQAAAMLDDREEILELAPMVKRSPFLAVQACSVLTALPDLNEDTQTFVRTSFCHAVE